MGSKFACPSWNNPADFFMDMLSLDSIESEDAAGKPKSRDLIVEEFNQRVGFLEYQYQQSELKNDFAYVSPEVWELDERQFA
jgi:hypothetical protein